MYKYLILKVKEVEGCLITGTTEYKIKTEHLEYVKILLAALEADALLEL